VPLDLVPVDYVAETTARLFEKPRAEFATYHLTSGPGGSIPVGRLVEQTVRWAGNNGVTPDTVAPRFIPRTRVRRGPLDKFFDYLWHAKEFDDSGLMAALPRELTSCPRIESYLPTLLDYHWRSTGRLASPPMVATGGV